MKHRHKSTVENNGAPAAGDSAAPIAPDDVLKGLLDMARDGSGPPVMVAILLLRREGHRYDSLIAFAPELGDRDGFHKMGKLRHDIEAAHLLKPGEALKLGMLALGAEFEGFK